jgi:DNA-directed RNA polymerase subunit RPC12/RpoP
MIETICTTCGNKKNFDDSNAGRTFKCPNCGALVKIEPIGVQVTVESNANPISFSQEMQRAEEEKERQKKITANSEAIQSLSGWAKISFVLAFIFVFAMIMSKDYSLYIISLTVGLFSLGKYLLIKRDKLKNGD